MKLQTKQLNWQIAYFTLMRTVMNSGYRMAYPLLPLFASGLGVDLVVFATAFSVRSFLGVIAPFLAAFADTRSRRSGMVLGIGLYTLGCGIVVLWPGFLTFVIASTLIVIGNGVFIPSMQAYLGDHIPFEKRGTVMSITELSWALAFIIGVPVLGDLLITSGWVAPFILLTGLCLVLGALLFKVVPHTEHFEIKDRTILHNLKQVITYWPALAGLLMGLFFTSANETVNLVFGLWIESGFGLAFATLTAASIVIGTSELASELLSALIIDRIGKKRAIFISLVLNCVAALLLPLTGGNLTLSLLGLGFFYITFEFALISAMTLMSEVLPNARATIIAATVATFSLGRMFGDLITPALYAIDFWAACLAAVVLNILSLGFLTQVKTARESETARL
ncbi:MAG: MFS transporter [Anaerolineaceae bacterium]|nr:MFS transporter [Anaerolineaceae bacterium]